MYSQKITSYRWFCILIRYSKCKQCIIVLLKRIGDAYKVDKRQKDFILDLMKLKVPKLLLVPEDDDCDVEMIFIKMIQTFIRENELKDVIMHQILSIVVTLCVCV